MRVTKPTTYMVTAEITLRYPSDYLHVTDKVREVFENLTRYLPMQVDGPFFEKKKEE